MDIIKLIIFLSSGIGQFIVIALLIGLFLPHCILEIYGFIIGLIFIALFIISFVSLLKWWIDTNYIKRYFFLKVQEKILYKTIKSMI